MTKLTKEGKAMKKLGSEILNNEYDGLPVKVVQFGEGNFLRAFVDWMFDIMLEKGLYDGRVAIVQPIEKGRCRLLDEQDGMYTVLLRGIKDGTEVVNKRVVKSIASTVNPYTDYGDYLKLAKNPDIELIVSNTTEAGIAYDGGDSPEDSPPSSFPGKLTVFLYRKFSTCGGRLHILPCELIDRNGDTLRRIVLRLAEEWGMGEDFIKWVKEEVLFHNTLVDRIVTGYPSDEMENLQEDAGYTDEMYDTGEYYHLWVIEGEKFLPLNEAGLNVVWTHDMTPYRTRKVRILNGAHTMTVPVAYLAGLETVGECIADETVLKYMKKGIYDEIIPTLDLPEKELLEYADDVLERFSNPYIKHRLLDISLNSISKFKVRVLPSITAFHEKEGRLPETLVFSLAALGAFHDGSGKHEIRDDMDIVSFVRECMAKEDETKAFGCLLSNRGIWGGDLSGIDGLAEKAGEYYRRIKRSGMRKALEELMNG